MILGHHAYCAKLRASQTILVEPWLDDTFQCDCGMAEEVCVICLNCKAESWVGVGTPSGRGEVNHFCNGECEDRYAARL